MPLIDRLQFDALCDLAAGDSEFIVSVIDAFLPQLVEVPNAIRQGVMDGDIDTVAKLSHSLKGSASNVGAAQVAELCKTIEEQARQNTLEGVLPIAEALVTGAAATMAEFEAEKAKLA